LDGLALLVDSSLVKREQGADGEPRFVMLETIREYALERLETNGEAEVVRQWHAEHYLALAETAAPHLDRADAAAGPDPLGGEHDNLRGGGLEPGIDGGCGARGAPGGGAVALLGDARLLERRAAVVRGGPGAQ